MSREMKDSGIEWIGEIPKSWRVVSLGKVSSIQTGSTPSMQGDENYYENGEILWVKPDNLNSFIPIEETKDKINHLGIPKARIAPPNTPLICCIGSIGKFGYSQQGVAYNQQINSVDFDEIKVNWKYGLYYLSTQEEQHWYYSAGNVVRILNSQNQKQIKIPMPTLREQQQIANFLDQNVAEIDHIIDKTKESIDEYKKYKQSIITEIVTKGLNPNVEMKDSGIEWTGDIPKHWEIKHLNQIFSQVKNRNKDLKETNLLSLSYGKIIQKDINTNEGLLPENFEGYNIINNGNIVLRLTDLQNDHTSLRVGLCTQTGIITSAYISLYKKNEIDESYAYYYLHSFDIYKGFYGMGSGVRQGLTYDGIKKLKLLYPPIKEQEKIVNYLDTKIPEIDKLISQKQQLLTSLETYKKSLIYECVTGKRKV